MFAGAPSAAPEVEGCEPERIAAPVRRPPLPASTTAPTSPDPLGGFLPSLTPFVSLEPARIPITDLPEGASHQVVANSLAGVGRLRRLELQRTGLENLEPLQQLERLEVLLVFDTAVSDVTPLAHLTMLRELDLRSTRVADAAPLSHMHRLKSLALDETEVKDIRPLLGLRCLESLSLSATAVASVRGMSRLRQLRHLALDDTQVTNLWPLARVAQLRELSLTRTKVVDLRPLVRLKNLRKLSLNGTPVADVRALARMPQLEQLDLRGAAVTMDDMDVLIDALPYTVIHTNLYKDEIQRLQAAQKQMQHAMYDFSQAELLWALPGRQMEALDLARESLHTLVDIGVFADAQRVAVATWLTERGAGN